MWKKPFHLFHIGFKIIDIEDAQFEGTHNQTGGIDTLTTGEELLDQLVLTLLEALHTEGHTAQTGNRTRQSRS